MRNHIKLLLIGDEGVGKSSLISSFVSRHFPEGVPSVMADATVPPELTSNHGCVTITDSSARPGDREILKLKIRNADCVLALYDSTRLETLDSLMEEFLPLFNGQHKPVIVVGTKTDLLGDFESERQAQDEDKLRALIVNFPFVLTTCVSSAKLLNVDHVIYDGVVAVTCPLHPLYDVQTSSFTPAFKRAFLHIFRLFDTNGDNLLNDTELSSMQQSTFSTTLNDEDLRNLKRYIRTNNPTNGLQMVTTDNSKSEMITFEGFQSLWKVFLMRARTEQIWAVLRRLDYDDDLNLQLPENLKLPEKSLQSPHITILSADALWFLNCLSKNCAKIALRERDSFVAGSGASSAPASTASLPLHLPPPLPFIGERDCFSDLPLCRSWVTRHDRLAFAAIRNALACISPDHDQSQFQGNVAVPWAHPGYFEDASSEEFQFHYKLEPSEASRDLKGPGMRISSCPHKFLLAGMSVVGTGPGRCSLDYWMFHWHMLAMYRPALTQNLLFRLGYVERPAGPGVVAAKIDDPKYCSYGYETTKTPASSSSTNGKAKSSKVINMLSQSHSYPAKHVYKLCVLGKDGVGKRSLVWAASDLQTQLTDRAATDNHTIPSSDANRDFTSGLGQGQAPLSTSMADLAAAASATTATSAPRPSWANGYDPSVLEIVTGGCVTSRCTHARVARGRPHSGDGNGGADSVSGVTVTETDAATDEWEWFRCLDLNKVQDEKLGVYRGMNHLVLTSVPASVAPSWLTTHGSSCDCAVLMVDCSDRDSFQRAKEIEALLADHVPRVYVLSKTDRITLAASSNVTADRAASESGVATVLEVQRYIQENELRSPVSISLRQSSIVSASSRSEGPEVPRETDIGADVGVSVDAVLSEVLAAIREPDSALPLRVHNNRRSKRSWAQIGLWSAGIVAVGVASAGVYVHLYGDSNKWPLRWRWQWLDSKSTPESADSENRLAKVIRGLKAYLFESRSVQMMLRLSPFI